MQDISTFISNHTALSGAAFILIVLLMIVEFLRLKRNAFFVSPMKATQLINHDNAVVIDIRSKEAYNQGHIIDSEILSTTEIQNNPKKIERFRSKPIIIVCNSGVESQKLAAVLLKRGYNAYSLAGGLRAWSNAQMPLVKE